MSELAMFPERLAAGQLDNPREVLGWHRSNRRTPEILVRTWNPEAAEVRLRTGVAPTRPLTMTRVHPEGLFETRVQGAPAISIAAGDYAYEVHIRGETHDMPDPYAAHSIFGELDLHLFGEGNHFRIYEKLGAHPRTVRGVSGINFAVWAPNARQVTVIGHFNGWDGRRHPMQRLQQSGIWELFIPEAHVGDAYKFRLTDFRGETTDKADPYAFAAELPPQTASVIHDHRTFQWADDEWMERRRNQDFQHQPISVYELHLGSWRQRTGRPHQWLDYRTLAHEVVDYCRELNFTHLELLPVSEHPYTGSWGYQTTGYFAATSRYGSPDDFKYFVDYCHRHGLGVIIDWVPAHFPKDAYGLARFDGTHLYEHADPRQGEHPDWNTLIFNYDRNEVRNFLTSNALYWLDLFHIDGLRVDAVASMLYLDYSRQEGAWIPNAQGGRENLGAIRLLQQFNREAHGQFPGVLTIAEESTAWPGVSRPVDMGGLGFSIKWNMGWMNDTLRYMRKDPIHRKFHHDALTFSLLYAFSENFMLPFSHDEVVHGKGSLLEQMPGDSWQKFANLRMLYAYLWTHPGKKLLFMGNEFGQRREWNCNAELDWSSLDDERHRGLAYLVRDLNRLYVQEPALHDLDFEGRGFQWMECDQREESRLVFVRRSRNDDTIVVACNFTPIVRPNVRIGVPQPGIYRELFNSDSTYYGGSNVGNLNELVAESVPHAGQPNSLNLTLPPLAVVLIKIDPLSTVREHASNSSLA